MPTSNFLPEALTPQLLSLITLTLVIFALILGAFQLVTMRRLDEKNHNAFQAMGKKSDDQKAALDGHAATIADALKNIKDTWAEVYKLSSAQGDQSSKIAKLQEDLRVEHESTLSLKSRINETVGEVNRKSAELNEKILECRRLQEKIYSLEAQPKSKTFLSEGINPDENSIQSAIDSLKRQSHSLETLPGWMSSYAVDIIRETDIVSEIIRTAITRREISEPDEIRRLVTIFFPARVDPFSVPADRWETSVGLKNDLEQLRKAVRDFIASRHYKPIMPEPGVAYAEEHNIVDKTKTRDDMLVGKVETLVTPGVMFNGKVLRQAEVRAYVQDMSLEARPISSGHPKAETLAAPTSDGKAAPHEQTTTPAAPPDGASDVRMR